MELCTKGLSTSIVDLKVRIDLFVLFIDEHLSLFDRIVVYLYHVFEHVL